MGFAHWYEALIFILVFSTIVGAPCFAVVVLGTQMVNDMGNFPTKAAEIQSSASWKVLLVEIIAFFCLAAFFHFFN